MVDHYPLSVSSWDEQEIDILKSFSLDSRMTMGDAVQSFEESFARKMGGHYCLMVNSGSSANLLAVASLFFRATNPLKAGDEVIVPAVSWSTSYFPLQQYGLKVKFVDIDVNTLNIDIDALRSAMTEKTRLVIAVNLLGNPCQFNEIKTLCDEFDTLLLEDNCESMGARYDNQSTGTFGILGTFSSYFSHHISTIEGGMVVTDDEELYHIMLSLRSHGWTRSLPWENTLVKKSKRNFEEAFRFILPGYNLRSTEINALLGLSQLDKLDDFLRVRKDNALYFKSMFSTHPYLQIQLENGESSWFGFSLLLKDKAANLRDELCDFLEAKGIENRPVVAGNFTRNEVIKYFDYEIIGNLDSANKIDRCGFYLGNHHFSIEKEIAYAYELITGFLESRIQDH